MADKKNDTASPMSATRINSLANLFYGTAEKTIEESPYVPSSMMKPYNTDDLYRKSGDYRLYEQMELDDQIHVCQSLKRDLVLGSGWTIVNETNAYEAVEAEDADEEMEELQEEAEETSGDPKAEQDPEKKSFFAEQFLQMQTEQMQQRREEKKAKKEEQAAQKAVQAEQERLATDIYKRLEEDPDVSFDDQLEELITTAFNFGFSISEKIFKMRNDNTLTWKELKTRHPNSWLIHTDKYGNVQKYEQRGRESNLEIPPESLIHIVNNRKWQNPYGRSDLRPAYDAWMTKRHLHRYFAIFTEKYASPIPVAKYANTTPKEKVSELFNIIKTFMQKTALAIPKDLEIEFLESTSTGEAYIRGINLMNMFIGRSLLVPDLLGFSGSESQTGGSQALGREQMNIFLQHIKRRRRMIERIVNKHIIQPLVAWNHGEVECMPKFQFLPVSEQDAESHARTFIEAMKGKLYKPNDDEINHFRSLIRFPEGRVEREEGGTTSLGLPLPGMPQPGQQGGLNANAGGNPQSPNPNVGQETQNSVQGQQTDQTVDSAAASGGGTEEKAGGKYAKVYESIGTYDRKTDYARLEKSLDDAQGQLMARGKVLIGEIIDDLVDQLQKMKIIGAENPDMSKLSRLKVKRKKEFQMLLKRYLMQFYYEQKQIAREEITNSKGTYAKPMPSDQFLNYLEQETWDYIGDWEYKVTQGARIAMQNAVKDGLPLSSVVNAIDTSTVQDAEVSLERYSRTKYTEVMNRARVEEFTDSGVVQGFQYSAIMDDRTTDICAGLNGKTFKLGDEPIPPLHFNCRSVLIPITIYETFEPSTQVGDQDIGAFIDENKGTGFSTR